MKYFNDFTFITIIGFIVVVPFILLKEGDFNNSDHLVWMFLVEFALIGVLIFRMYRIDIIDKYGIEIKAKILSSTSYSYTGSSKVTLEYEYQNFTFKEEISVGDEHIKEDFLYIKIDPKNPQKILVQGNEIKVTNNDV